VRAGNERILYVDDEQLLVDLGADILTGLGYVVNAYSDSELALAAYRAEPGSYDLVITDLTMPRLTGVQLAEEVKKLNPQLPVILCTGHTEIPLPGTGPDKTVQLLLRKPLSKRALAVAAREVLDRPHD
jgi:CheY-like chemotaxis protein